MSESVEERFAALEKRVHDLDWANTVLLIAVAPLLAAGQEDEGMRRKLEAASRQVRMMLPGRPLEAQHAVHRVLDALGL